MYNELGLSHRAPPIRNLAEIDLWLFLRVFSGRFMRAKEFDILLFQIQTFPIGLTLLIPSSKSTFSQPFKKKCISEVVRIGGIIISPLSKP